MTKGKHEQVGEKYEVLINVLENEKELIYCKF